MDDDSENQLDCFLPRMSNDDDSNDPFKGLGEIGGSSSGREGPFGNGDETSSEDPLAMASMWHSNSPPTTAGMSTSEPPSAAINPEIMRSYESQQFVDADLIGQRYAEEAEMDERNDTAIDQNQAERRFVRDVEEMHQMDAFQHLDNEGQIEQLVGRKVENSMNLFLTVDTDELEKLDCEQAHSGSLSPTDEGDRQPKEEGEKGKKEYSSSHSRSRDVSMDQSKASTSKRSSATPAPASSIAGSLARVTDFIAQEDQRVLKIHGFGPIHIPCERLEIVLQRDKKDAERRRIKTEREQRLKELDERRKLKDAAREKRRAEKGGVDTDSEQEEIDSKKNKKSKGRKKHGASVGPSGDSVRDEAQSILKRNFNRIVQCCVCELIVSQARFDGRETVYCSQNCIKKKVEQAKKCVKEGERIILIDMKGSIMNSANLTIQNMEAYLHQNPNYQPIINSTQIEEEASQRDIDPTQQKKIDKIRMECSRGIEQALTRRSKEANMNFSIRRYKEMGHDIERALYSLHQDVDVKYRRWFRAFLNVLTDDKNGFFRDVMRDKVSVKKLVTMTSEQMNSLNPGKMGGAMAGTSIVAAADSTSVSETPKVDDPNVLPSSNGGKDEAIVTLGNKIATTSRHTVAKKMAVSNVHAKSAIDDILGTPDTDSTYLHNSHLYDANCKICKMKNQQKFAEKERQEKMEAKLEAKRKAEEAQLGRINFPNLDPTIEAAMHDGGDGGIDDYMPTSSSSASYAAAKRRREELEAEEERRLRDPLGLVDITPVENPPLPPDQLLAAGTAAADDYEDEPMEFSGAADFDDFQDDHHFVEPSAMVQNHTESMDMDIDNDNEEFGNVAFEKAAPKQFNAADREINHQLLRPPPMAHKRPRTPVENQPFVKHHHGAITTTSSLDGIDGEHHQPPPHEGHGENWKRRHAPPVAVPEEEIDPWASTDHQIWKGRFAWNKTIFFDSSLIAISNRGAFKAAKDLPPALHVMGKSEPLGVWQYIGQLKDSWDKQVILLIVEPPTDPTQLQPYGLCYEKINCSSSQQIAVLDLKDHNQIKDGYVFALNPAEPLPKILYPLEGPGLPEWCRHKGCIVVMLIRRMDREDKLWRRRADETWRPRTLQPCGIPLEMVPCPENKLPLLARDPRLDERMTRGSKIYKPERTLRDPRLVDQLFGGDDSENREYLPGQDTPMSPEPDQN